MTCNLHTYMHLILNGKKRDNNFPSAQFMTKNYEVRANGKKMGTAEKLSNLQK